MSLTLRVFTMTLLGVLSVSGGSWAQTKNKPPDVEESRIAAGTGGTPVKKLPVITDDDISLLAVRAPAKSAETLNVEAAKESAAKESGGVPRDPENIKTEILALERQVKDKQRQIELLMRIFVCDEQAFLKDPSGQLEDDEARAKRKFEQEELLEKAKEIAQLRTRLNLISSAGGEKAAPAER
ncbi:MAG: hypothetical protein WAM58_07435 [Candidatus Acidiferrum sp.]